jgi:hypothetical protein
MDPNAVDLVTKDLITAMRRRLETVASVAKAGSVCAEAGRPARAVEIVIELGEDLHEVNRLFEAALAVSHSKES